MGNFIKVERVIEKDRSEEKELGRYTTHPAHRYVRRENLTKSQSEEGVMNVPTNPS